MALLCPNCEATMSVAPVVDEPQPCKACGAMIVVGDDGEMDVQPADGQRFEVPPEELNYSDTL